MRYFIKEDGCKLVLVDGECMTWWSKKMDGECIQNCNHYNHYFQHGTGLYTDDTIDGYITDQIKNGYEEIFIDCK